MGQVDIPDASLTIKGKVQLSSETDSAAEDRAATPKAVKDAALQAKSYTDQQISLVTETGIPKLVSYPLLVTATADNQKVFEIPLDLFDANTDTLLVAINRAVLDATQYTVTNTIRDGAGQVTQRAKINLLSGVAATSEVTMVVLKNVPIGPDGAINGAVLAVDSVPVNRISGLQDELDTIRRWGAL
ncbi:phage tail protein [Paenibacillus sp. 79R4]|uniref:phage tail protein n=1 Tax=Paenibacillus sp. 79R4 TaxID=2212847 RepID=UPI002119692A|nr:phage tail protein [Paenibacillus sp. 79R4]